MGIPDIFFKKVKASYTKLQVLSGPLYPVTPKGLWPHGSVCLGECQFMSVFLVELLVEPPFTLKSLRFGGHINWSSQPQRLSVNDTLSVHGSSAPLLSPQLILPHLHRPRGMWRCDLGQSCMCIKWGGGRATQSVDEGPRCHTRISRMVGKELWSKRTLMALPGYLASISRWVH